MKAVFALCAIVLVLGLAVETTAEGCKPGSEWTTAGCVYNKCSDDGKSITGKACPQARCAENKQIGYEEGDQSKSYPECCGRPICKN